eukprot:878640-Prorocentrum_minimum.AAC.1
MSRFTAEELDSASNLSCGRSVSVSTPSAGLGRGNRLQKGGGDGGDVVRAQRVVDLPHLRTETNRGKPEFFGGKTAE